MTNNPQDQIDIVDGVDNVITRCPLVVQSVVFPVRPEQFGNEARSMALQSEIWGMVAVRYHPARKYTVFGEIGLVVGVQHSNCVEPC